MSFGLSFDNNLWFLTVINCSDATIMWYECLFWLHSCIKHLLTIISGDENKLILLEMDALKPITNLINHEDKVIRRFAVMAFGVMAGNG